MALKTFGGNVSDNHDTVKQFKIDTSVQLPPIAVRKTISPNHDRNGKKAVLALVSAGCDEALAARVIDWLLQKTVGKAEPTQKPTVQMEAPLTRYAELFQQRYNESPHLGPQDYKHLASLIREHGVKMVLAKLDGLAFTTDGWLLGLPFTFDTLARQWNRLAADAKKTSSIRREEAPPGCQHQPRCATKSEHTARYLADVTGSRYSETTS